MDGRSISESFFPVDGDAIVVDDLALRLTSVMLGRRMVYAFVEVDNRTGPVSVARALLRVKDCSCNGGRTREELEPGQSTFALAWRKRLPLDRRRLRVKLELRHGSRPYEFTWSVDLHERRAEGSGRQSPPLRALMQSRWVARPVAILPWALFAAFGVLAGVPLLHVAGFFCLLIAYVHASPVLDQLWRR